MQPEDFVESARDQLALVQRPLTAADLQRVESTGARRSTHVWTFIPRPLPPDITYDEALVTAIGRAMLAIGRLDHLVGDLPNPLILVRPFTRREAVASSRIEGTAADAGDIAVFAAAGRSLVTSPDALEVENYRTALEYALSEPPERQATLTFIRALHRLLLDGVRGHEQHPGEIRTGLVLIGRRGETLETARYVPPPPWEVEPLLRDLERYIQVESGTNPLVRLALVHYQFEAIHPFWDGNGRVGRLLIPLFLQRWGVMAHPIIDVSAFVLRHRDHYLDGLLHVSRNGDWRGWIDFFVEAFEAQAANALARSQHLLALRDRYLREVASLTRSGARAAFVDHLFQETTITARQASDLLGVSFPTAQSVLQRLSESGVLSEVTGQRRNRLYVARQILDVLDDFGEG